jgi:DNA-binding NtrC family response regulator
MARILIVDTQTELCHQLVRLLEQAGHRATAVATISEAASLLKEHVPDLLATNVVLTDGSGTNLAKQAEAAGAKVLMITGSPDRIVEFDAAVPVEAVSARGVLATGPGDPFARLNTLFAAVHARTNHRFA